MYYKFTIALLLFAFNASIFSQSQFINALRLNGSNQYLEIPDKDYLNVDGTRDYTFEIMFKPVETKQFILLSKFIPNTKWTPDSIYSPFGQGFFIDINKMDFTTIPMKPYNPYAGDNYPGYKRIVCQNYFEDNNTFRSTITGSFIPKDTTKYIYYAFYRAKQRTLYANEYIDYINGQTNGSSYTNAAIYKANTPLLIGGYLSTMSPFLSTSLFFKGDIDEIRIWNRKRTPTEIQATYADTLAPQYYRTADSGLVAYYRFDKIEKLTLADGTAYDYCIRDLSVNKNHAKVINGGAIVIHSEVVGIDNKNQPLPTEFSLYQNYPNPFNPSTTINFSVPRQCLVNLKIFDTLGKEIATLVNEEKPAGKYSISFNAANIPSGIYFYRMIAGSTTQTKKMIVLK